MSDAFDTLAQIALNGIKMAKRDHAHVMKKLKEVRGTFTVTVSRAANAPPPKGEICRALYIWNVLV